MHEETAKRGATLAGRAHGAEGDGAQRHVEIGGRADDTGIVAAKLQNGAGEAFRQTRADIAAHAGGAGGRDERHLGIVHQCLTHGAVADQQLGQAFRRIAETGGGTLEDALNRQRRKRRLSEGFQTTELPQTMASAAFHDHTATGKLKAEITPTTPSGCQVSIIRWPGRSVAMVRP